MSQVITNKRLTPGSLRGREAAHTVLRRMALEAERAERIAQLKASRPDLTWRQIGDTVGVSERSAIAWQRTGGIDYGNAKKLAKLFGVAIEWLWSGMGEQPVATERPATDGDDQLDRIERKLDAILKALEDAALAELREALTSYPPTASLAARDKPVRKRATG